MKYAGIVVALVVMAYLVMEFNSRTAELNRLRAEQVVVDARLKSVEATYQALEAKIAYATSDAAVIEWAYENHQAMPQDQVIVPVLPLEATPTPRPLPAPIATPQSNWSRWLMLFLEPLDMPSSP